MPADTQEMKEGPGGEAGAFKETSQSRDQGALDAPILSQSTIATSAPTRRAWERDGPGDATCTLSPAQMTYPINDRLAAWFPVRSLWRQRLDPPFQLC